eukprot:sb/3463461/
MGTVVVHIFQGFYWYVIYFKKGKDIIAMILCTPVESTKEWNCIACCTLTNITTGLAANETFESKLPIELGDRCGWGMWKLGSNEELTRVEKFTLEATITVKKSYIGPSKITKARSNHVIFHRMAKDFFEGPISSHEEINSFWITHSNKTDKGLQFVIGKYNLDGQIESNLSSGAVIITVRGPNSIETRTGNLGENIVFETAVSEQSVVTFLIHDQPFSCEAADSKGFDFGIEELSLPTHGNAVFSLQDETKVPLNSMVLAYNSPVLSNLIEKEGELEHDMSDFEPESVRIFADACYTGKLDILLDTTEFKVLSDFVKMVNVFKVDWAKDGCLEFYKRNLPIPCDDFDAYWNFAILALDSAVKYSDRRLLDYLLSSVQENRMKLQFRISRLLAETTKRSHLDLVMVMVVEFDLANEFMQQALAMMMIKHQIPLLKYWLENFNFSFCTEETLSVLAEAVELNFDAEISCKLMANITQESKVETTPEVEDGEAEEGGVEEGDTEEKGWAEEGGEEEGGADLEDGTLATVARNHWRMIVFSNWPCSNRRPFCRRKRELWVTEEAEKSDTEVSD